MLYLKFKLEDKINQKPLFAVLKYFHFFKSF